MSRVLPWFVTCSSSKLMRKECKKYFKDDNNEVFIILLFRLEFDGHLTCLFQTRIPVRKPSRTKRRQVIVDGPLIGSWLYKRKFK